MKFLHTMVRVKNLDKSLKFYQELIGLKLNRIDKLEDCELYFLNDGYSNVELELTHNFETPENGYENGQSFGHLAFETNNLDEFTEKLENFGGEYLYEPFILEPLNIRIAFVLDPDGREVEIIEKK